MKKNIIIICSIILGVVILLWLSLTDYLGAGADYLVSFYPKGWKEKAVMLSDMMDYLLIAFLVLVIFKWLFILYYKLKHKHENEVTTGD